MRVEVALLLSSLVMSPSGLTAADASPATQLGDYTPYDSYGSIVLCKTRVNDKNVKQIKWAPVYQMSGDENHQAVKIHVKVRVDPAGGDNKPGPWTTGKKAAVTPYEPFSKYRRAWTQWVGLKKERSLMVHLVWDRMSDASDYVKRQSLDDLPTADSPECEAV